MRSRCREMRSSSPELSVRSLRQRKTPFWLPLSWTISCCASTLKTACSGAMNGSLSSFPSPSATSRPTLVSSLPSTKSAERLPSRAIAETRAGGLAGVAGLADGVAGTRVAPATGLGGGGGAGLCELGGLVAMGGGTIADLGGDCGGALAGLPDAGDGGDGPRVGAGAPGGGPQRAQNFNVAALSGTQFGHCLGGPPPSSAAPPGFPRGRPP